MEPSSRSQAKRRATTCLVMACIVACGHSADPVVAVRASTSAPPRPAELAALVLEADARRDSVLLRDAARGPDVATRRVAVTSLARLHDAAAYIELRAALRDPDVHVRSAAALGVGAFEREAPVGAEAALLAALSTEADAAERGERAWDLGRVGGDATARALAVELDADDPRERVGACRGLAAMSLHGESVPAAVAAEVVDRAARDPDQGARRACAYAAGRVLGAGADAALAPALETAAADGDEEVRVFATRALGVARLGAPSFLVRQTTDRSVRVRVAAFRGLAQRSDPDAVDAYASALDVAVSEASSTTHLATPSAFPLLVALEEAIHLAGAAALLPHVEPMLDVLGARTSPTRADGLAHCRAAVLVDLGHGWPAHVTTCGRGVVSDDERAEMTADLMAHVTGDPTLRASYLARLYDATPTARSRAAVLGAAAAIEDRGATALLVRGIGEDEIGVVSAALEAGPSAATRLRGNATGALPGALRAALEHARARLAATDEVEGLVAWVDLAAALRAVELVPDVRTLASHPCRAVRDHAKACLVALGVAAPVAPPRSADHVIAAAELPAAGERLAATVTLASGERIEIDLLPAEAPTTVARFVALAETRFYDGLVFHRVVPGFVVQGGDPRGDGFGGPGFTQRCEDNRVRYERGTVGMALAGRDTGGSQFFVTTGPAPHLDGRYTAFGRVRQGQDVVDAILPGAVIASVRITRHADR